MAKVTRKKTKWGTVVATEMTPKEWAAERAKVTAMKPKKLNIETADRTLSKINKWVRLGYLSGPDAERLRRETIARVVAQ